MAKKKTKKKTTKNLGDINTYLMIALVAVLGISLYFTLSVPLVEVEEPTPPALRELTVTILGSDCTDCFNVTSAADVISQQEGVNVTEVNEVTLEEAKELTGKYNITRLPAVMIGGNITELTIPSFDLREDALVFDQTPPPYYSVEKNALVGQVSVIELRDTSCDECFNMSSVVQQLTQIGLKVTDTQIVEADSEEGEALIEQYNIEKVPTIIFSEDAMEYPVVSQVWSQVGTEESDGRLVLRSVNPPYKSTVSGKVEGLVKATYLADETCEECYDPEVFEQLLQQSFSMVFATTETLDAASTKGEFYVRKYNITQVPTVIVSKEADAYPNLAQAWAAVGTQEDDGAFVFRKMDLLGNYLQQQGDKLVYVDLESGETIGLETAEVEETTEVAGNETEN
jgi:hypothetical protein